MKDPGEASCPNECLMRLKTLDLLQIVFLCKAPFLTSNTVGKVTKIRPRWYILLRQKLRQLWWRQLGPAVFPKYPARDDCCSNQSGCKVSKIEAGSVPARDP